MSESKIAPAEVETELSEVSKTEVKAEPAEEETNTTEPVKEETDTAEQEKEDGPENEESNETRKTSVISAVSEYAEITAPSLTTIAEATPDAALSELTSATSVSAISQDKVEDEPEQNEGEQEVAKPEEEQEKSQVDLFTQVSDESAEEEESDSEKERRLLEEKLIKEPSKSVVSQLARDESLIRQAKAEDADYIMIEETILDDMGRAVKIKQKVPILRETKRYERVSIAPDDGIKGAHTHKYLETIVRVVKKSTSDPRSGESLMDVEEEIIETKELDGRPQGVEIYKKQKTPEGEEIEVLLPEGEEEENIEQELERESKISVYSEYENRPAEDIIEKEISKKEKKPKLIKTEKKQVFKVVKQVEIEPCSRGKLQEVFTPTVEEIEIEEEQSDFEGYETDEELSEGELEKQKEEIDRKRLERLAKLKDNLRTVLVRLALAEKKRNLYMQLISISSEVKEDVLNPPDPNRPAFKVPKKVKVEDKYKKLYYDKLMEYRELRSVILVKLAMEKKRKEEVKSKYDVIAAQVALLRKQFEAKLNSAVKQLLPKNDFIFKKQSAQAMVKRVLELIERLDKETKELMYKKKQMYLSKQKYDEITENEQGLSYKYALASKELSQLLSKNQRRQERLEALKSTLQKECMAIAQINQKCDAILKVTEEKRAKLDALNASLNNARQDRRTVHTARRKIEEELRAERANLSLKNHPYLLKEYQLVEELLRGKQLEFQQLKRDCLSSIERPAMYPNYKYTH